MSSWHPILTLTLRKKVNKGKAFTRNTDSPKRLKNMFEVSIMGVEQHP